MANKIENIIKAKIKENGAMPIDEYFNLCLTHKDHGYYIKKSAIGAKADFITAPEISQIFGELIAIWIAMNWQNMGMPNKLTLIEFGPGRATLMSDILRTLKSISNFCTDIEVKLIEINTSLKTKQKNILSCHPYKISWYNNLDDIDATDAIIIGNEFLDALSIKQFQYLKSDASWYERKVALDDDNKLYLTIDGSINIIATNKDAANFIAHITKNNNPNDKAIIEFSPEREGFIDQLCNKFAHHKISCLFIDYGYSKSAYGDSFQAIKAHKYIDPLSEPGNCDLTSHIDFESCLRITKKNNFRTSNILTQRDFLISSGILERLEILQTGKDDTIKTKLANDVERLISKKHMGELFKTICFCSNSINMPIPFVEQSDLI